MSSQVCRVCISSKVRMHRIDSNRLQEMFEKVTNTKLHAGVRPLSICYICLSQMQKSQRFLEMCQRAEEMFADLITNGIEVEKHSIDSLNIDSVQHISLSVAPTVHVTLNEYSINASSQVAVKEEPSGVEENANIVNIVKDEMDTEHSQIEESVISNNTDNMYSINVSSQVAVKEEPSGVEENANIVNIVKDEMDTEHFQIEESVISNNTDNMYSINVSSQVAVKEEPSGVEENANIVNIVKDEMDTEHFQIEESVISNNTDNMYSINVSSQVAVKEEPSGVEENANIVNIVKDEMDTEHFQIEESVISNNTDNIESQYYCDLCNFKCWTKRWLVVHIRTHTGGKRYSCNKCNKTFSFQSHLNEHIRIHISEKPHSCNKCNKTFSSKGNLSQHLWTHTEVKPYSCNKCNKTFSQTNSLSRHIKTHTGEKPYSCNKCGKTFSSKNHFNCHIRTHTGVKPHSCNKCNKTFSSQSNLSVHTRTHTGEQPYSCNKCNKTFSQCRTLNDHIRTHTGEKPFSCNECNKAFSQKSALNVHRRTHTGEQPYSCNKCHKSFSQLSTLKYHIRTHTGEKPYSCNECNKTFSSKNGFNVHVRTHTGEKPYSCNKCNKTFSSRTGLNVHIRTHTGEQQ